jgi:hypothetical protein
MKDTYYKLGCAAAIAKLGGVRVEVIRDETYQHSPDPAYINDAQAQGAAIDETWDAHDRRRHTQAIGQAVHPLAGDDG